MFILSTEERVFLFRRRFAVNRYEIARNTMEVWYLSDRGQWKQSAEAFEQNYHAKYIVTAIFLCCNPSTVICTPLEGKMHTATTFR